MAHEVQIFCRLDRTPAAALDDMLAELARYQPAVDRRRDGADWASCVLTRPGSASVTMLEIHGDDEATRAAVEYAATTPGAPGLGGTNGLLVMTLTGSGDADVDLVTTLVRTARDRWHGVPFDEQSGFAVEVG